MRFSDSTSTTTDWDEIDQQEMVDTSRDTENLDLYEYILGEKRERSRQQRLLENLVREHIKSNPESKSKLQAMFNNFLYLV